MDWLQKNRTKLSGVGGAVITIAGFASFQTWRDRLGDIGWAIHDNKVATAIVVFGILIILLGQWNAIRAFIFGTKRWPTDKDLGDEIHDWLRESGYTLQEHLGESHLSFNFAGTMPNTNRPVNVAKPVGMNAILLTVRVVLDDDQIAIAKTMKEDEMEDMMGDMALEVARSPMAISIDGTDPIGSGITLQHPRAVSDTMTKSQFMEWNVRMSLAAMLLQIVLRRHIRRAKQRLGDSPPIVTPVLLSVADTEGSRP